MKWNVIDADESFVGCVTAEDEISALVEAQKQYPKAKFNLRVEENTQEDHPSRR